jgi:hypothetical protein
MKPLKEQEIKALCQADDFANGEPYFRQGKVTDTWQTETSLHALVAGSGSKPYQVSITLQEGNLVPHCTCPAHRRRPYCKHVAALLVTWARVPEGFVMGQAAADLRPQSQVRRARQPKADTRQVQAEGLDKVEELLVELATYGLLSLSEAQVTRVNDLAHTIESHKLRRLARLVGQLGATLQTSLKAQQQLDEAAYAELLNDTWLTLQATRRALPALARGTSVKDPAADPQLLDELVGKVWRDGDLERRAGERLVEMAYESVTLSTGFIMDTSFLLSLGSGTLYTEKLIVPAKLKKQPRKPSYTGRLEGTLGIYPGPGPRRVKLLDMAPEAPLSDADWQQAASYAGRSVAELFRHFQAVVADPLAAPEAYALFAPVCIFVDGPAVHLLDDTGQAIPLLEGWRALGTLTRRPVAAIFGRLAVVDGALHLTPLGLVTAPPAAALVRVGA